MLKIINNKILANPIGKSLLANFYGIGINLFIQIILVPFFIHFWGVDKYGDWIILTAISSFFGMTDIGLNSVTQNTFSIKLAEGNKKECDSLLINNLILVSLVAFVFISCAILYAYNFNLITNLGLHATELDEARYVFILLILSIFLGMYSSVPNAIYKANSLNSKCILLDNTARLLEGVILFLGLLLHINMSMIITFYLLPRIFVLIFKYFDTKKIYPFKFRFDHFDYPILKKTILPSVAFMSFPLGNALIFQGFTLIVNNFFGVGIMILFNSTRTLTNFTKVFVTAINNSVWPEFSISFGKKDFNKMRFLHSNSVLISTILCFSITIFFLLYGNMIFNIWTAGKVKFNTELMTSFLILLFFNNCWNSSNVVILSTNNHSFFGFLYLITALLALVLGYLLADFTKNISITNYSILFMDLTLAIYTIRKGLLITDDNFKNFIFRMKKPLKSLKMA